MANCVSCESQLNLFGKQKYRANAGEDNPNRGQTIYFLENVLKNKNMYICDNCKLIQTNHNSIDEGNLEIFYRDFYRSNDPKKLDKSSNQYKKLIRRGESIAKSTSEYISNRQGSYDIFEFGAGHGFNLIKLKEMFPNANLYANDLEKTHWQAGEKGAILSDFEEKNYDIILLSQVLEHLVNPRDKIQKIISYLKKDGLLIIDVPNDNEAYYKIKDSDEPHITFFSIESINSFFLNFSKDLLLRDVYSLGNPIKRYKGNRLKLFLIPLIKNFAFYRFYKFLKHRVISIKEKSWLLPVHQKKLYGTESAENQGILIRAILSKKTDPELATI